MVTEDKGLLISVIKITNCMCMQAQSTMFKCFHKCYHQLFYINTENKTLGQTEIYEY